MKRSRIGPATFEEALARKATAPRSVRAPLHCRKPMKRGAGLRVRPQSKTQTMEEGSSERAIRDENDELIRKILRKRDSGCINEDCKAWSNLHPGHYITRKVLALRWDLDNCWSQCDGHNAAHNEDPKPYRRALVVKVGLDRVREMEAIGRKNPELQYVDLLKIRDGLRAELKRWK